MQTDYRYPYNSTFKDDWQLANAREPDEIDLAPLGHARAPYWWPFNYNTQESNSLQAQQTLDGAISPAANFILLKLLATASQPKGFRTQFRQLINSNGGGLNFSRVGIEQSNVAGLVGTVGTPQAPFTLPIPYATPNLLSILNRTANKANTLDPGTGVNDVQICMFGMREAPLLQE